MTEIVNWTVCFKTGWSGQKPEFLAMLTEESRSRSSAAFFKAP